MKVLDVRELVARRGSFQLGPLTLAVEPGQIVCVAGPNGSGKTTLLGAILGMVPVRSGEIDIVGDLVNPHRREHMRKVGYIPDDPELLLAELTAIEYWRFIARTRDHGSEDDVLAEAELLAARLELDPGKLMIRGFSHGMRKKTQVVAALMHTPELLVIDELRNGLDPIASRVAEQLVSEAQGRGCGVLVSTHDLYWAERHADEVMFLHQGATLATGSPSGLQATGDSCLEDSFLRIVGGS